MVERIQPGDAVQLQNGKQKVHIKVPVENLREDTMLIFQGILTGSGEDSCVIELCSPHPGENRVDVALGLSVTLDRQSICIVACSVIDSREVEDRRHVLRNDPANRFEAIILATESSYKMAVNGSHVFERNHFLPLDSITYLNVRGNIAMKKIFSQSPYEPKTRIPIQSDLRMYPDLTSMWTEQVVPNSIQGVYEDHMSNPGRKSAHLNDDSFRPSPVDRRISQPYNASGDSSSLPLPCSVAFTASSDYSRNVQNTASSSESVMLGNSSSSSSAALCAPAMSSQAWYARDGTNTPGSANASSHHGGYGSAYMAPMPMPSNAFQSQVLPFTPTLSNTWMLPEGIRPNQVMTVGGILPRDAHSFSINLLCGNSVADDIVLAIVVKLNPQMVVRNSRFSSQWGINEDTTHIFPFSKGSSFEIQIVCTLNVFHVYVNSRHLFDYHARGRFLSDIRLVTVDGLLPSFSIR